MISATAVPQGVFPKTVAANLACGYIWTEEGTVPSLWLPEVKACTFVNCSAPNSKSGGPDPIFGLCGGDVKFVMRVWTVKLDHNLSPCIASPVLAALITSTRPAVAWQNSIPANIPGYICGEDRARRGAARLAEEEESTALARTWRNLRRSVTADTGLWAEDTSKPLYWKLDRYEDPSRRCAMPSNTCLYVAVTWSDNAAVQ